MFAALSFISGFATVFVITVILRFFLVPWFNFTKRGANLAKSIQGLLVERGKAHGDFSVHAACTQQLKGVLQSFPNWEKLSCEQKEVLEMVAHKIGRIMSGDPNFHDHWQDASGYFQLAANKCGEPHV